MVMVTAKELLALKPAEWEKAVEVMSWTELKRVAEIMRKCAKRVDDLSEYLDDEERQRKTNHTLNARAA
jgi:hypothetical protein